MDAKVIVPSERLKTKYHVWVWLIFVFFFLPFTFLGFSPGLGWAFVGIYLGANVVWMAIAYLLIPPYYRSISYELGDEDIIVKKGIITKSETMVPYRMVTNASVKRGPMDRLLGIGTLEVHTAGYSQQAGAEANLPGLEAYDVVRQRVMAELHRYRAGAGKGPVSAGLEVQVEQPAEAGREVVELLQQILTEIKTLRS